MPTSYASITIPASAERVWVLVRDFDSLDDWHPGVSRSMIEDGHHADRVGVIRHLTSADGEAIRERLVDLDDGRRRYTYDILDSPFAVRRYRATIRVAPVTEGNAEGEQAFVEWWAHYDCEGADEPELDRTFAGEVFAGGLAGLRDHFEG